MAEREFKVGFLRDKGLVIGNPPKIHRFDLVSEDNGIAIECKCYTWTETGNVPSVKMGFTNEAVFYLSFLESVDTYLVMKKAEHPKHSETIAAYYYRMNRHLLGQTRVMEYDTEKDEMHDC